jgi:hypothetical protein
LSHDSQLENNPLTEEGGRALFRAIIEGLHCRISLKQCSFQVRCGRSLYRMLAGPHNRRRSAQTLHQAACGCQDVRDIDFNYTSPRLFSPYLLDLGNPINCAILHELCVLASVNPRCEITGMTHFDSAPVGKKTSSRKIDLEYVRQVSEKLLRNNSPVLVTHYHDLQEDARFGTLKDRQTGQPFQIPNEGFVGFAVKYRRRLPDERRDVLTEQELGRLLDMILRLDPVGFEDCLALASDDIYVSTQQVEYIMKAVKSRRIYETEMDVVVSVLSRVFSRLVDCHHLYAFLTQQLPEVSDRHHLASRLSQQIYRCEDLVLPSSPLVPPL